MGVLPFLFLRDNMLKRVTGGMCLNTKDVKMERVDHAPEWLATRDEPFQPEKYPDFIIQWYRGVENGGDYLRMWPKGQPCPYEKDMYDLIYPEDIDDDY
jgi:hypothetical protein